MKACKVSPTRLWIQYIAEVQVSDTTQCKWNTKGPTDLARGKKLKGLMAEKPSSHQSEAENRTLLLYFFKLSMQLSNSYCQLIKHPTWTRSSRCWRHWTQPACKDQSGFPGAFPAHPYGSTWAGSTTTHWTNSQHRAVPTQTHQTLVWPKQHPPGSAPAITHPSNHCKELSWAGPPNLGATSQLLSASSEHTNGRKHNSKAWKEIPEPTEGKYSKDLFNNTQKKKV